MESTLVSISDNHSLTPDDIRKASILSDQSDESLEWLLSVADEVRLEPGGLLIKPGDAADHMVIVVEGSFQFFNVKRGQRLLFASVTEGEITGLLPFSRLERYDGEGIATSPSRLARVHRDHFMEMITRMPEVGRRLVARMTDRVRERSRTEQQQEKMVALGKLSAGLAHELNNPAAAIRRAASSMRERLDAMPALVSRLTGHGLSPLQIEKARAALVVCSAPTPGTVSALDRSDREDELADWLEDHGVARAYVVAEVLADEGITTHALEKLAADVPDEALSDVILWIEKGMAAERLLGEVERASARISELVGSIKSYSHMDQSSERQPVDLHGGLDSTLTMLGHQIKKKSVRIVQEYAPDLPPVPAYPGELNQVWTNLIDNAIDAIEEGGEVRISTRMDGTVACVTIADNGTGMPDDVRERIFDPFYTTKEPGEGTGLGLDIVARIIRQHQGKINVKSVVGEGTAFEVCLPV